MKQGSRIHVPETKHLRSNCMSYQIVVNATRIHKHLAQSGPIFSLTTPVNMAAMEYTIWLTIQWMWPQIKVKTNLKICSEGGSVWNSARQSAQIPWKITWAHNFPSIYNIACYVKHTYFYNWADSWFPWADNFSRLLSNTGWGKLTMANASKSWVGQVENWAGRVKKRKILHRTHLWTSISWWLQKLSFPH